MASNWIVHPVRGNYNTRVIPISAQPPGLPALKSRSSRNIAIRGGPIARVWADYSRDAVFHVWPAALAVTVYIYPVSFWRDRASSSCYRMLSLVLSSQALSPESTIALSCCLSADNAARALLAWRGSK